MKIRAKVNGDILDVSDETAEELIDAGIYEAAKTSTKVEPLTTKDVPPRAKKAKAK